MTTTQDAQTALEARTEARLEGLGTYKFGWSDSDIAGSTARRGINPEVVRNISSLKSEPQWMLDLRLKEIGRAHV